MSSSLGLLGMELATEVALFFAFAMADNFPFYTWKLSCPCGM